MLVDHLAFDERYSFALDFPLHLNDVEEQFQEHLDKRRRDRSVLQRPQGRVHR